MRALRRSALKIAGICANHGQSASRPPVAGQKLRASHADIVVVVASLSIGCSSVRGEDFDRYPRTFQADCDKLRAAGCATVFAPDETSCIRSRSNISVEPPAIANEFTARIAPDISVA